MKKWFLVLLCCLAAPLTQADPLPAAEVFRLEVKKIDPNTFALNWQIKPGYFLYSDRIRINTSAQSNLHLGALRLPPTLQKTDKQGRTYPIYRNELSIPVSVLGEAPGETLLTVHYQGCSDEGFCYPPEQKEIKTGIDEALALSTVNLEENPVTVSTAIENTEQELSQIFSTHHWSMTLLIFFGFGLLLSFTPCILPMVPVLSGIIVGHGKTVTTRKAFFLSLSYVLSMSVTYAILGAVIALLGANLQINMQSPLAITLFSCVFVALALSMFGFYEFKLPNAWQAKIAGSSQRPRGGHYIGAAIMGCLSTLILSPCVTAPLIGVLTYIAQSHNVLLGSLTLFVLSLGMGTPLLLIGVSAGKLLPKSGSWMNAVKAFFGILLLGVAIYLMQRIMPPHVIMLAWACLFVFSGIYAGALSHATTHKEQFQQGTGIILLIYGLLILIGSAMGSDNPLQPLAALRTSVVNATPATVLKEQNVDSVEQSIKEAQGIPVMLDFYADWCASCKEMEATTFQDPEVKEALSHFKIIKIDLSSNNEANKKLMNHFNVIAPPTFLFFDEQGQALDNLKVVGEVSAPVFLKVLSQIQSTKKS